MALLITGGCGYIGSHIAVAAALQGMPVVVLDMQNDVPEIFTKLGIITVQADCGDGALIRALCAKYALSAAVHCAALIDVGESVLLPHDYYDTNVARAIACMNALSAAGVDRIIFSSSCAVYGVPLHIPIPDTHPRNPISPYGRTKCAIEWYLEDMSAAGKLRVALLRYFNAAGGSPEWGLFERHEPESHLIPRIIAAARDDHSITIFGTDYPTPDGTAIRDYVHVQDLADAHLRALDLLKREQFLALNLGTGKGFSVAEIVAATERVLKKRIKQIIAPRRPGDPAQLIADPTNAARLLGWKPRWNDLEKILLSCQIFS
jgi:UDP-glucose-4-epimerase GalE